MKYINRQTIAGFIGNSPELRYMPNGQAVIELRVATAHSWKDRANNQWHKETEWHNCVAYRDDAEKIAKIYTKGDAIYIEGRTRTREWEAKDKSKRSRKELMIELHNKIDAEGADLSALLADIQATFGKECLPLNLPDAGATRVVDCFYNRAGHSDFGAVADAHRALVEQVVATTGAWLWLEQESLLDAVTALSGSGPAYVFYFLEAMTDAGEDMGLTREQAHQLAVATFAGASELARRSDEPPAVLRQRVTSKGGTTYAAITHMQEQKLPEHFIEAMRKAQIRAQELAAEFGK